jgi:hypothetical protein
MQSATRADAGRSLASFAGMPEATGALLAIVLDADDTFVTRVTATALLQRHDRAGLAVVASALAAAGPGTTYSIYSAFTRSTRRCTMCSRCSPGTGTPLPGVQGARPEP